VIPLFLALAASFSSAERMPIGQVDSFNKIHLINGDPYSFVNTVKYCHNYPDIMCYERGGNARVLGDEGLWTFRSCTDLSGLGALYVRFPNYRDTEDANMVNGIYHPINVNDLVGAHVAVGCMNGFVRFHPGATIDFSVNVPAARFLFGTIVKFSGPPDKCFAFSVYRGLYWRGQQIPPVPPENEEHGHDDL